MRLPQPGISHRTSCAAGAHSGLACSLRPASHAALLIRICPAHRLGECRWLKQRELLDAVDPVAAASTFAALAAAALAASPLATAQQPAASVLPAAAAALPATQAAAGSAAAAR